MREERRGGGGVVYELLFLHVHLDHVMCEDIVRQGGQVWARNTSDWPQMGQILEFFQIRFITFWLAEPFSHFMIS